MPFVWSIGSIIGPAIGGTFASPHDQWPVFFNESSIFTRFPYLLPNIICAFMLLISIVAGWFLLVETHPDHQPLIANPSPPATPPPTYTEESPLFTSSQAVEPHTDIYGTTKSTTDPLTSSSTAPQSFTKPIIALVAALGIFTYHTMTYDHLLPIFFEDQRIPQPYVTLRPTGGLGLSLPTVGLIMSVQGINELLIQALLFPLCAAYFGVHKLFVLVTLLQPITYILMPYLVFLPESSLMVGIYIVLFTRNLLSVIAYPLLLILIKERAGDGGIGLGRINGLAAAVGAGARTIAPPVAGYLYMCGENWGWNGVPWYGSCLVAMIGGVQCLFIARQKRIEDADDWENEAGLWDSYKDFVTVNVVEVQGSSGYNTENEEGEDGMGVFVNDY